MMGSSSGPDALRSQLVVNRTFIIVIPLERNICLKPPCHGVYPYTHEEDTREAP